MKEGKRFNYRGFINFLLIWSFIIISLTGLILYIKPPGRVANWINWKFLGLTKTNWESVHTLFGYMFILTGALHLYLNWKIFTGYFRSKVTKGIKMKRELFWSLFIILVVFIGTYAYIPPFSQVMNFGDYLSNSWEEKDETPPVPHAEQLSLKKFASIIGENPQDVIKKLRSEGIKVESDNEIVENIAEKNSIKPIKIYEMFVPEKTKNLNQNSYKRSKAGSGYGKMTLKELCDELAIPIEKAVSILENKNIKADKNDNVRSIADKLGIRPYEVKEILSEK